MARQGISRRTELALRRLNGAQLRFLISVRTSATSALIRTFPHERADRLEMKGLGLCCDSPTPRGPVEREPFSRGLAAAPRGNGRQSALRARDRRAPRRKRRGGFGAAPRAGRRSDAHSQPGGPTARPRPKACSSQQRSPPTGRRDSSRDRRRRPRKSPRTREACRNRDSPPCGRVLAPALCRGGRRNRQRRGASRDASPTGRHCSGAQGAGAPPRPRIRRPGRGHGAAPRPGCGGGSRPRRLAFSSELLERPGADTRR